MLKRDITDRLQILVVNRFREEQPKRELTKTEIENIWHIIYGKLNRGEIETKVEEYCKSVELSEIEKKSQMSVGAAMVRKMIEAYEKSL